MSWSWFPLASDVPVQAWQVLTLLAALAHLTYFPRAVGSGRKAKLVAISYPLIAFVAGLLLAVVNDVDEEFFWAGCTWAMLLPTLIFAGNGRSLEQAEQAHRRLGGAYWEHVPEKVMVRMRAQIIAAMCIAVWVALTGSPR